MILSALKEGQTYLFPKNVPNLRVGHISKKVKFAVTFLKGKYIFFESPDDFQFNALFKSKIGQDFILKLYQNTLKKSPFSLKNP